MNRRMDICGICRAMKVVRLGDRAVSTIYACEDAGTRHIAGMSEDAGIEVYIDSLCTEEEWTKQEIPGRCRCYAEYFLADCNRDGSNR